MDPNQQLALYQATFPGMAAANMGNAPAGTTPQAGQSNAMTKLILAMMQARAMQKYRQQYPGQQQPQVLNTIPPTQGQTLSAPGGLGDSSSPTNPLSVP